jgi:hypothetical protein
MLKIKPIVTGTAVSIRGAVGRLRATTAASDAPGASPATAAQPAATPLQVMGTLPGGTVFTGASSNRTTAVVNGVEQPPAPSPAPAGGNAFTAPIQDVAVTEGCSKPTNSPGGS